MTSSNTISLPASTQGPRNATDVAPDLSTVEARVRQAIAVPPPPAGRGRTRDRWSVLVEWGRGDLGVARLAEGHVDALAILVEAGCPAEPGALYGVWAARPGGRGPRLVAGADGRLRVSGTARFCSGAGVLDRALVVVEPLDAGAQTVLVELGARGPGQRADPGSWGTEAMAGSLTRDVEFTDVPVKRVLGDPGWYIDRPGFAHGGGGVAAVWWGGAAALLDRAREHLSTGSPDPHRLAHLGELHALLAGARALLDRTADMIDDHPTASLVTEVDTLRALVERAVRETLERVPRLLGPGPLSTDRRLATHLADLGLYVRQHHGEADHAALGARLVAHR